jgi:hypothetical protein
MEGDNGTVDRKVPTDHTAVKIMAPLALPGCKGLANLELLESHLVGFLCMSKGLCREWAHNHNNSSFVNDNNHWGMRQIQLGWVEIFLKNEEHPVCTPAALVLSIYMKDPQVFWDNSLYYAEHSARQDTRVTHDYEFGSFSLICTTDEVSSQVPHMDTMLPNYQFTTMATNNTPGTVVYNTTNKYPVQDVPSFMN